MTELPLVAITMGDPAGVGPEVTAKALARDEVWACCRPLVVGDLGVMSRAGDLTGCGGDYNGVSRATEVRYDRAHPDVLDLGNVDLRR